MATLLYLFCIISFLTLPSAATNKKVFIVHVDPNQKPQSFPTHNHWYTHNLKSIGANPTSDLLYTYKTSFHGFAATLSQLQVHSLKLSPHIINLYEDSPLQLHTTRSPYFLRVDSALTSWPKTKTKSDLHTLSHNVVIGFIDTGLWPYSHSFDDDHMPPVPNRWKGRCVHLFGKNPCNRKLIGFKRFYKGYMSVVGNKTKTIFTAVDTDGHGTHTASTAAGAPVKNASFLGYGKGTAMGMAAGARIAMYKACWPGMCFTSDVLKAFNRAVYDGVDIISISLGGFPASYFRDLLSISTFNAMRNGVFVSASAGNDGPGLQTVTNISPWITTVAAGTIDRKFSANVHLGDGRKFEGESFYKPKHGFENKQYGLFFSTDLRGKYCVKGYLNRRDVKRKVVICLRGVNGRMEKAMIVSDLGGVGMILVNSYDFGNDVVADPFPFPALMVGSEGGEDIIQYFKTQNGSATVSLEFIGAVLGVKPSPMAAGFSSRGPSLFVQEIMKPDLMAPGVNIIAAWSPITSTLIRPWKERTNVFNVSSGTSMSCPHVSGLAALVKAAHPGWSPSAIKSAMMTTASVTDNTGGVIKDITHGKSSNYFLHGQGQVDIEKALFPGLVYDITPNDYIDFLCSLGYDKNMSSHVRKFTGLNVECRHRRLKSPGDLNYPAFSVVFLESRVVTYTRVLTNVEACNSTYNVAVYSPSFLGIEVTPRSLSFGGLGDKKKYVVSFTLKGKHGEGYDFGKIVWSSHDRVVYSAVSAIWSV